MHKDRYDEFQVAKRHKYGHHAFFLTITLIIVNGIIKMNYIWAEPLMETLVLLYIPMLYMTVMAIWQGAYISKKEKNPNVYIPMLGVAVLFNWFVIGYSLWDGVFVLVVDGKLVNSASILFTATFFTLIVVTMIIRRAADFRALRAEW